MAAALYQRAAVKAGRNDRILSRGTDVVSNAPLEEKASSSVIMQQYYNIDISGHVPTPISLEDIKEADLILVMKKHQANELSDQFANSTGVLGNKLHTFGNYIGLQGLSIDDPVGKTIDEYYRCAKHLESWVDMLVQKLNSHDAKSKIA